MACLALLDDLTPADASLSVVGDENVCTADGVVDGEPAAVVALLRHAASVWVVRRLVPQPTNTGSSRSGSNGLVGLAAAYVGVRITLTPSLRSRLPLYVTCCHFDPLNHVTLVRRAQLVV